MLTKQLVETTSANGEKSNNQLWASISKRDEKMFSSFALSKYGVKLEERIRLVG